MKKFSRYQRNLAIGGITLEQQEKLISSKVLVMGAGGLGSGVVMNLAALGIGQIKIIDNAIIEEENLLDSSEEIAELIKNSNNSVIICKCCEVLKEFGKLDLINKEIALKNIATNDAKALIESYFKN